MPLLICSKLFRCKKPQSYVCHTVCLTPTPRATCRLTFTTQLSDLLLNDLSASSCSPPKWVQEVVSKTGLRGLCLDRSQ